jgi:hypothetical protein
MIFVALIAIYGLAFFVRQSDGPFDVMNKLRNWLLTNKYVGVFFFNLLECWFCVGCHCGWIVYLLYAEHYTWQFFIIWTLTGGVVSLILDDVHERLRRE